MNSQAVCYRRPPLPVEAHGVDPSEIRLMAREGLAPALATLIAQAVRRGIESGELFVEDGIVRVTPL